MTVYDLLIFNPQGSTLFSRSFHPSPPPTQPPSERQKLIFGMLFSLGSTLNDLHPPSDSSSPSPISSVKRVCLPNATLHAYTTPTSLLFCAFTSPDVQRIRLEEIWDVWVEVVSMCGMEGEVEGTRFGERVEGLLKAMR